MTIAGKKQIPSLVRRRRRECELLMRDYKALSRGQRRSLGQFAAYFCSLLDSELRKSKPSGGGQTKAKAKSSRAKSPPKKSKRKSKSKRKRGRVAR